jgi:hypothetical protein
MLAKMMAMRNAMVWQTSPCRMLKPVRCAALASSAPVWAQTQGMNL